MRATLPLTLTEELVGEIARIGLERMPSEACGILLPTAWRGRQVFEMPNRAIDTTTEFLFHGEDVTLTIEGWLRITQVEHIENIVIWHTHPGGGIGPSRVDMRARLEDTHHLVVSLHSDGTTTPTWY